MNRNKFTTYLLYAVGETFLVVIGILIAVSINNWNEQRKNRIAEQAILKSLVKEFDEAEREAAADSLIRYQVYTHAEYLLALHLEKQEVPSDSIISALKSLLNYRFYTPAHPTLDDIINSGRIELIQSDSVRNLLQWYLQDKDRIEVIELRERLYIEDYIEPYLSHELNLSLIFFGKQVDAKAFNKIFMRKEFGSLLYGKIERTGSSMYFSYWLYESIISLQRALRAELGMPSDTIPPIE